MKIGPYTKGIIAYFSRDGDYILLKKYLLTFLKNPTPKNNVV